MRYPRHCKAFRGQFDVAPWAGLFFVLVLFFVLQTSLFFVPGVRIDLPTAKGPELAAVTNATATIMVDRDARIFYNHQLLVDRGSLRKRLEAAIRSSDSKLTLIIQADRRLDLQMLVELKQLATDVGIQEIVIASRPLLGEGRGKAK